MDIDIVYLWVNGNDPAWQAKRDAVTGKNDNSSKNCKGRYAENDELKYSLRSLELYAPWIRRVFIVTDSQVPEWLDTSNPKVRIVDHREILPPEALPCFNSLVIEHFLPLIPGLSEHFLYANDDTLLNRPVTPADFFTDDGLPYARMAKKRRFRKLVYWVRRNIQRRPLNHFNTVIENASRLVESKSGKYISWKSHHNIDAYLKSDYARTFEMFKEPIMLTITNHTRGDNDISRHLYSYAPLLMNRMRPVFVDKSVSQHVKIHLPRHYELLERLNPMFFCMNDSEFANDNDRQRSKEYLQRRFPEKSGFEI